MEFTKDGAGLVVKLGQTQTKNASKVMKFECEEFSCFPDERETLFFGGVTELKVKGIMKWAQGRWRHYDKYMEPIDAFNRMMNGLSLKGQAILDKAKSQRRMNIIIRDQLQALLSPNVEMNAPQYVNDLVSYQRAMTDHVRLRYHDLMTYEWMHSILVTDYESDRQLKVANIAVLFCHAESITFMLNVAEDDDFKDDEWDSVINGLALMHKSGCSMTVRFELSSDEDRQDEMHQMAMGYQAMLQSEWQCDRVGNVLVFNVREEENVVEDVENGELKQSQALRERVQAMITLLTGDIQTQKANIENAVQRQHSILGVDEECSVSTPISRCPSARIIKEILKRLLFLQSSEFIGSIRDVLSKHNHTITDLLNDIHHIKYVHSVDHDDDKFDEALAFFEEISRVNLCRVEDCEHVLRHYRHSEAEIGNDINIEDEFLLDTVSMIHCYFLHSLEINRFSKSEKEQVEMEITYGQTLDDDDRDLRNDESDDLKRARLYSAIMSLKRGKSNFHRIAKKYRHDDVYKLYETQIEDVHDTDVKDDEKESFETFGGQENSQMDSEENPEVYEVGKQFYFWDSFKGYRDYVKATNRNMKEEVMHSPLLNGLVSMREWDKLTQVIEYILSTEYAQRIISNGSSCYIYGIEQYEPFDALHLRALKLFTDFAELCDVLCATVRRGNPFQIAHIARWTRALVETVQCYGIPLNENETYYREVSKSFPFKAIATKFNLPLCVTSDVE